MAEKNNAICSICGNSYYVCFSCKDSMKLHPYKTYCCSADCYKVFQVVRGFSTGVYNKEEFKSKLKNIDLTNLENYREHIKTLIKDVLNEEEPVAKKLMISRKRDYKIDKIENKVVDIVEEAVENNVDDAIDVEE